MTEQRLREELQRIADGAPPVHVPADLYDRARGKNFLSTARTVALVAACVALVAGLVAFLGLGSNHHAVEPAHRTAAPTVPGKVYAAPTWLGWTNDEGGYEHSDDLETDLTLGISTVAYPGGARGTGYGVVVDGRGRYHLLDLPGFMGRLEPSFGFPLLAISPDGRRLAWSWANPTNSKSQRAPSGIRIADLTSGKVTTWDLTQILDDPDIRGYGISGLTWSPDSRRVLWTGERRPYWTLSEAELTDRVTGTVTVGAPDNVTLWGESPKLSEQREAWAVGNDGTIAHMAGDRLMTQKPGGEPRSMGSIHSRGEPAHWSLSFRRGTGLYELGDHTGIQLFAGPSDTWSFANPPQSTRMLGWVRDSYLLVRSTAKPYDLQLVDDDGKAKTVVRVSSGFTSAAAGDLTVAYDLIDPTATTAAPSRPDFPDAPSKFWETPAMVFWIGLPVGLTVWWLRRRPRLLLRLAIGVVVIVGILLVLGVYGFTTQ